MGIGGCSCDPSPRSPLNQSNLKQERLVCIFNSLGFFSDGDRQRRQTHRPASEFRDDGSDDGSVDLVQPQIVDLEYLQGFGGGPVVDYAVCTRDCIIADSSQKAIGDSGCSATSLGDHPSSAVGDLDIENPSRSMDNHF